MKGTGAKRNVFPGSYVSTGAKFPVAPVESAPMLMVASVLLAQLNGPEWINFQYWYADWVLSSNGLLKVGLQQGVDSVTQKSHWFKSAQQWYLSKIWGPVYKISYEYLTIMPKLRSTYDWRPIYQTSYKFKVLLMDTIYLR